MWPCEIGIRRGVQQWSGRGFTLSFTGHRAPVTARRGERPQVGQTATENGERKTENDKAVLCGIPPHDRGKPPLAPRTSVEIFNSVGLLPRVRLRSLSVRLLVPLLVLIGAALALHAFLSYRATRERFVKLVSDEAHHYANLILRTTHDRMLLDREVDVQRTMTHLAEDDRVVALRIFDPEGRIVQSAAPGEVGSRVNRASDQPCTSCHVGGQGGQEQRTRNVLTSFGDTPALRHLAVIPNERSCATTGCHRPASEQPVLGLLDVELTMVPLQQAMVRARTQTLWTMLGMVLVTGVFTTGLVNHLVHKPMRKLLAGTRRLAAGDLDARIELKAEDELAHLARSINHMAADVQAARHEVTKWSRQLEEKVVAKSDELRRAQGQVIHMERMASLGKLAATVAHELNNPMSGILMCARLVERELQDHDIPAPPREEIGKNLRLIQDECRRCGSIVQNLLLFARQSEGAPMAPVDVNVIAERSLMLIRHRLQISDIALEYARIDTDPCVVADAGQLEQAMVALLVNAVEALSAPDGSGGGGRLSLRLCADDTSVTVEVADTGVGIHPDVLPQIFEPFFSTKHQESGVGLGLAVVFGIVQRHNGTIDVTSEPGRGATFTMRLPRRQPGQDAAPSRAVS